MEHPKSALTPLPNFLCMVPWRRLQKRLYTRPHMAPHTRPSSHRFVFSRPFISACEFLATAFLRLQNSKTEASAFGLVPHSFSGEMVDIPKTQAFASAENVATPWIYRRAHGFWKIRVGKAYLFAALSTVEFSELDGASREKALRHPD